MMTEHSADIAIIGGTGMYDTALLTNRVEAKMSTPFGHPSDLITIGELDGVKVAFLPRHGRNHTIPPHCINYRANIWALKAIGVTRIISPSAVGSLDISFVPGDIILPDQFIDFTRKRDQTFYSGGRVCHISVADPFCPELRDITTKLARKHSFPCHNRATYLCIEGPRFSTRAESKYFREVVGAQIIGMTLVPECVLAREVEICYVSLATITDFDVWAQHPVSSQGILAQLQENVEKIRSLIKELILEIPISRKACSCKTSLKDALV
jgi:5'-methylthioadenosine phosphorylase